MIRILGWLVLLVGGFVAVAWYKGVPVFSEEVETVLAHLAQFF